MRTFLLFGAALLSTAACASAPDTEPTTETSGQALTTPPSNTPLQVASAKRGGCMDHAPGIPANFPWAQQYQCHNDVNQRFRFVFLGEDQYLIKPWGNQSHCLDIPSSNASSGQDIQFHPCNGGLNQRWRVIRIGASAISLQPVRELAPLGSLCVDVEGDPPAGAQARLQLFTCHYRSNQLWYLRQYLGTEEHSCDSGINLHTGVGGYGNHSVASGTRDIVPVLSSSRDVQCADGYYNFDTVECPSGTNWMLVDRSDGRGDYEVGCYRQ